MPARGRNEYVNALLKARARSHSLTRAAVQRVNSSLRTAIGKLPDGTSREMTHATAQAMRQRLIGVVQGLEDATATGVRRAKLITVKDVVRIHAQINVRLFRANGVETRGLVARFGNVSTRAVNAIASRPSNAATFKTLIHRHMEAAVPDMDRLITASVARGVTVQKLTNDIADVLAGDFPSLRDYDMRITDLSGLRTIGSDARRIAVSETNNALREANAMAMRESPIVAAARWQRSGNMDEDCDECAELAAADDYGFGEGFYPPDAWPLAPHPNCACYAGDVIFTPVEEWGGETQPADADEDV